MTPVTEELFEKYKLDNDSVNEFYDLFDTVPLLKSMASKDRVYAKDLPRENGKITVDLTNPHILEDMDYFRQAALHFKKTGRYTDFYPTKLKSSDYYKFWKEEERRCKEGYVRESDGEWITGYHYFYLNYTPIMITRESDTTKEIDDISTVEAERVQEFPFMWDGDYLYFHYIEQARKSGKFGSILKTRGRGYSFKGGSKYARNYYHYPRSKSYAFASDNQYLLQDGILNKAWDTLDFVDEHTPWGKAREKVDKIDHKRASYVTKVDGVQIEKGYKSEIIGVTTKDDPDKARGKRGMLISCEESGNYPHLLQVWKIAYGSMKQGRMVYGFMESFGTGGTSGSGFEGAEALFYNGGFNVFHVKNIFDRTKGQGVCAFYVGEYLNREYCYDKDGNSDVVKAMCEVLNERQEIRNTNSDPSILTKHKADYSITPQEACMRTEGTLFPVYDLREYLQSIAPVLDSFTAPHLTPKLNIDGSIGDKDHEIPIRTFPLSSEQSKIGAIEIFTPPLKSNTSHFRYIIGVDPYDDDEATFSKSLGSAFVFDTWTDEIVAEYTGRPRFANDFYEVVRRLSLLYNAKVNYENKNKGLFSYFDQKHSLHLLADTPKILIDKEMARESYGNKAKGTPPTKEINRWGRRLQRDWMLSDHHSTTEDEKVFNLQKIRSIAYLKEAIQWNSDDNFDRVSSMGMVMILREEYHQMVEAEKTRTNISTLSEDPFWTKNNKALRYKKLREKMKSS